MKNNLWAVTLSQTSKRVLEERIASIAEYLANNYQEGQWQILHLDATGKHGGRLTLQLNDQNQVCLPPSEFLDVLKEDGQIIELDAVMMMNKKALFKIIVQDGSSIDVLGKGKLLPSNILGAYDISNPELFLWE